MPTTAAVVAALRSLPPVVNFTLTDGTRLTAGVRLSARARGARLTLDMRGGLQLTVPRRMPPQLLEAHLVRFLPWLERAWRAYRERAPEAALPDRILLPLTGEAFRVETDDDMLAGRRASAETNTQAALLLRGAGAQRLLVVEQPALLRLFGAVADTALCARALRRWCRARAARLLPPYLEKLAAQGGFDLCGVTVRDQRSRWGSCSRRPAPRSAAEGRTEAPCTPAPLPTGHISLNWRALLLPAPLLEHLCWHELCHLRHMNHSPAYRAELARHSPRWPEREKALNAAWRGLPWWALPEEDASPVGPEDGATP
ncbi:MAG: M48 family metallopeptidase [Desulfovibrio desulfuricans]|nr:M48 family metallopeptidase [Desulfovibrio desulfuricans]